MPVTIEAVLVTTEEVKSNTAWSYSVIATCSFSCPVLYMLMPQATFKAFSVTRLAYRQTFHYRRNLFENGEARN